jgi:hypothetical protein
VRNGLAGTSSASSASAWAICSSRSANRARSAGQHPARDDRITGRQRIPGGGHQPFGDRPGDPQFPVRGEPDEPGDAHSGQPGRVGELGRGECDLPWCPTHPAIARVNPGNDRSSCPSSWFFVAVRVPTRRCRCAAHAVNSETTSSRAGNRDAPAGQHQFGDRFQVERRSSPAAGRRPAAAHRHAPGSIPHLRARVGPAEDSAGYGDAATRRPVLRHGLRID